MERFLEKNRYRLRNALVAALSTSVLAACAVGPNFHAPEPPATARYTPEPQPTTTVSTEDVAGGAAQDFVPEGDVPAQWWRLLHSEPLDELIERALKNSPTVAAAEATLRSAAESYGGERGALLLPTVDGSASATREKTSLASFGIPNGPTVYNNLFSASVQATYKLDLFGGSRRQIEGLRAQADYQRWELEAARLTLTGNVVTTAVNMASLKAQLAAIHDIVASEREQLAVTERQFAAGTASHADVLAQQAQLAQTEASLPALEKQLAQAGHRLAVLAGETPDHAELNGIELDALTLPTELPVSLPANLIRQRPDVQAAEAQLHQASAQVGVATANLYPALSLTGSIGSDAAHTQDLLGAGSGVWSVAGTLAQPLFHGGQLRAQRRAAIDDLDGAAARYRETVLEALQQVADTLRALESDARDLKAQMAAEGAARDSLAIARRQYAAGVNSHVAVLIAERQYIQARESRVLAQAARYSDSATLFQSLGGGWWNRSPESQFTTGSLR
ncbi:MAG: efflux transporter outer membrane subunit [Steroidobacteraceae bacterium]|jgi:NodT family efflux transporter outer membrane factor (OMF) lipoprotein